MDPSAILPFLSMLGPWGPFVGAALVLGLNYYRGGKVLPPVVPGPVVPDPAVPPPPLPVPIPVPPLAGRPVLSAALQLLSLLAAKRAAGDVRPHAAADPTDRVEAEILRAISAHADPS